METASLNGERLPASVRRQFIENASCGAAAGNLGDINNQLTAREDMVSGPLHPRARDVRSMGAAAAGQQYQRVQRPSVRQPIHGPRWLDPEETLMANFWENDPIVGGPSPMPQVMPASAAPAAGGDQWWANDPIVEQSATAPAISAAPDLRPIPCAGPVRGAMGCDGRVSVEDAERPSAQERYDAALERVRQLKYPDVDPEAFRKAATGRQDTIIPGISMPGPLAPYDATQLSQHGMFFGLTDEATAGMDALGAGVSQLFGGNGPGMGDVFAARQELEAARRDLGREELGGWGTLAEIVGGMGSGGGVVKGATAVGARVPGLAQNVKAAVGAGSSGAAYGFGATDGDLIERGKGAGTGRLPLLQLQWPRQLCARSRKSHQSQCCGYHPPFRSRIGPRLGPSRPTKASYKAAERTGAVVDGGALNLLNHDVTQALMDAGMLLPNGRLVGGFPKVNGALSAMRQYMQAGSLTVKQARILRRTFSNIADSNDATEAMVGNMMLGQLDDFFEGLPVQAFSTNGKAGMDAVQHWARARKDYSRFKRTETIEKAVRNAGYAKEGLRTDFAGNSRPSSKATRSGAASPTARLLRWNGTFRAALSRTSCSTSAAAAR